MRHVLALLLLASVALAAPPQAIVTEDGAFHIWPGGIGLPGQNGVEATCNDIIPPATPLVGEVLYCRAGSGWCAKDTLGNERCTGGGAGGGVTSISNADGTITLVPNPITTTGTVSLTSPVAVANGGTAQTVATNHDTLIGDGANWNETPVPDCHSNSQTLTFTQGTNLFGCNSAIAANTANNVAFAGITGPSTNTTAAMTVGTGASLTFSGTGTVNASQANGAAIGTTTPITLGDTYYANATPAITRLPGSTSSTKNFLTQTGTGVVSAPPSWGVLAASDIPSSTAIAGDVTGTLAATTVGKINNVSCLAGGDCLPQYLLLAGRSGGQTANGGTATTDSLVLQGTANGSPTIASTVDIKGTTRFDPGPYLTSTDSAITLYAPTNTITTDSQLVELFRGTTTVGGTNTAVVRGLSPRHFAGATNGAKFVFTGNPNPAGSVEMFTEDADYWNQQNTSITTGPFTAYGDGRRFNIDSTVGNSPIFTINNSNSLATHAINSGVNTQGVQLTASGGGTGTGVIQEWDGLEMGAFLQCQSPWTITNFIGQFQTSPGGACHVTNETGMDINLTQGTTRISTISRDPGTTMRHAGRVIMGAITVPAAVSDAVASSTNPIASQSDFVGTTGANQIIGTNSFAGTVEVDNAGGSVIGYAYPGTLQLDTTAAGNYAQTSLRTVTNKSASPVTSTLLGALTNQETVTANNAALTLNDTGSKPSYVGYENIPTFNRIGTPNSTAQTIVGDHLGGNVGVGWTVTTWDALKADPPAITGTVTNLIGLDLGNMTGATTNLSMRSTGGSMEHAGNVRIGDTGTVPTHPVEVTTASAATDIVREDATASITGAVTGLNLFPAGLSLGASHAVFGVNTSSTWTLTGNQGGFGDGNFFNFSPTITNTTAITTKGMAGMVESPLFQPNGAALTMTTVLDDDFSGTFFGPSFKVLAGGTGTAQNVVGLHSAPNVSTGWTITNLTPVQIDPFTFTTTTGLVTNYTGVKIGALNSATSNIGVDIGAIAAGGTLNAGMRCAVASGANNMCIQGTGTADSRLLGDLVIGSSSLASNALLHVTAGTLGNNTVREESGAAGVPLPSERHYWSRVTGITNAGTGTTTLSMTASLPNDAPCPASTACQVRAITTCHCTSGTACTTNQGSMSESAIMVSNSAATITLNGAAVVTLAATGGTIASAALTVTTPTITNTITGVLNFVQTCDVEWIVRPVGT